MSFSRLALMIGEQKMNLLQSKTVLIVGLGGVGGNATEAIARSGFGHIILVDQDEVEASNINRQLIATTQTLGIAKVEAMKVRIHAINPACVVDTYPIFYNEDTKSVIWEHPIDYVIDCIDTITYKIDLVKESVQRNIPIISVMGTGNKFQPELLSIVPLHKTTHDPIARIMRQKLREFVDLKTIMVVASTEQPRVPLQPTSRPASNAFVPNTAGILAASYIFRVAIGEIAPLS